MPPFAVNPETDTICDVARRWAEVQPDAPALVKEGAAPITYGDVVQIMDCLGAALSTSGLGSGARIGLVHSGGPDMGTLLMGIMDHGVVAPLNPTLNVRELAIQIDARRIDGLVVEAALETDARDAAGQCGVPIYEVQSGISGAGFTAGSGPGLGTVCDGRSAETSSDPELILATSGTTSAGKVVPFSRARMLIWSSARTDIPTIGPADRCLVLRPLYYAAGIHDVMATIYSGGAAAVVDRFDIGNFFHYFETFEPTWFGGSPAIHERIYTAAKAQSMDVIVSKLRFVRVSSGLLDASIADDLEHIFAVPLLESYGATEAGSIASNPGSLKARKRGTVGVAVGCSIKIIDEGGSAVAAGERGEVTVKGPQVFDGYENDDEANVEAFVDGWFRTGDEGFFDAEGYLTLTSRIKEMINRGGEKVSPSEVDAALMGHPGVREAATFPISHQTLGEEVAAAVVWAPGAEVNEQALSRYLRGTLASFKVPRCFVFVDEIPKDESGKVRRHELAGVLGIDAMSAPAGGGKPDREATRLEARLQSIWAQALKRDHVGLNDNFFLLGGDSLQAVDLFLVIENELKRRLPVAALFEAGTVVEMAKLIEREKIPGCMVPIQPMGKKPPFFCVHGNGGEVIGFYHLARHLGPDQPFYGIQSIGWDGTVVPFTSNEDMAAYYVAEMRKVQPEGPYYFGGYSFGGRIAVYMARQLRAAGQDVAMLAILDSSSFVGRHYSTLDIWLARRGNPQGPRQALEVVKYLWFKIRKAYDFIYERLRRASLFPIWGYYRRTGHTLPRFLRRPSTANKLLRIAQAKMPAYEGDAVYFKTVIEPHSMAHPDTKDSWDQVIRGKLDVVPVPGTHEQIIQESHAGPLAEQLWRFLAKAQVTCRD